MKRLIFTLTAALFFIAGAYFSLKFAIIHFVQRQLENLFAGSTVTINDCALKPAHLIRFSNIEINNGEIYNLTAKEADIQYNISSLLQGAILKFRLKDAFIKITLPKRDISEFSRYLNLNSKSAFLIKSVELSNLHLNIDSNDFEIKANLSSQLKFQEQLIDSLDLNIDFLNTRLINIKNAFLNFGQTLPSGILYINLVKYNKLEIREIRSKAELKNKALFLESLSAKLLGGQAEGDLNFKIAKDSEYLANLNFINLNADAFINDFNLEEKLRMSGKLNGSVILKANLSDISILKGDFSTLAPGGNLVIKDKKILENIASSSKQPLEIIVESFKDYRYNVGIIKVRLDKNNLIFNVSLDGIAGKRDLTATIYGLKSFLSANMPFLGTNENYRNTEGRKH